MFVSVLNPHEPAKNLTALIGGFLEFHSEHPKSLLLLKLIVDNAGDRLDNLMTGIRPHISGYELIDSDAVWLATAQLAEPALADLYRFSSAYLCSSSAEGENTSLQEAMACGAVPITTRHTAMLDYIGEENAIIINSERRPIDRPDTAMGHLPGCGLARLHERRCRVRIAAVCRARRGCSAGIGRTGPRHDRARIPQLLADYDWVFIGSPGWLIAFDERISQYGLDEHYRGGAIKWLGYVDEYQKAFLYRYAELAIYPSFFEGFGIPVVEAMYFGCPVACSCSSGIPEAGGDAAFYFDPTSLLSFEQTLLAALRRLRVERAAIRAASRRQALRFTWHEFARRIDEAIAWTVQEINRC